MLHGVGSEAHTPGRTVPECRRAARRRRAIGVILATALIIPAVTSVLPTEAHAATSATVVRRGPTDRPRIALTFDDNCDPTRAAAVIDVLRRYDVPVTMFVLGVYVTAYPNLTQAIATGGFEVGDHTQSHQLLTGLAWSSLLYQIGGGTARFAQATGRRTLPLFRPPYGATNAAVAAAAGQKGFLYEVLWDVDTNDWQGLSAATIRDHVLSHAHNGAIVLMHLSAPHTAEALPGVITGLRNRGYQLVTVSTLLKGNRRFLDLPQNSPVTTAVLRLVDKGMVSGYDANYFGPSDPMTRAQLAKVAVLTAGLHTAAIDHVDAPTFVDVPLVRKDGKPVAYPYDYIEEAVAAGILAGKPGDKGQIFSPNAPVTRGQLAQVVARMARELKRYPVDYPAGPATFNDVPPYAANDVALTAALGLMNGYSSARFDMWSPAQRGHLTVVMSRFLDLARYQPPPPPSTTTTTRPTTTTTALPTTTTAPPTTTTTLPPTTTTLTPTTTTTAMSAGTDAVSGA